MIMPKKKFAFLVFLVAIFLIGIVGNALALDWPPSPGPGGIKLCPQIDGGCSKVSTLTQAIEYFWRWAIVLGGLAAFVMLLVAGFQYLTSTGDPGKTKDARDRIASAIGGLVLLLASFVILNVINPELTLLRTPELTISEQPQSLNFKFNPFTEKSCEKVTAYNDANQKGVSLFDLGPGDFRVLPRKIGTAANPGSLKISRGCLALLYPSSDASGDATQFSIDIPNLNVFYNDGFGSIRVVDNTPPPTAFGQSAELTLRANETENSISIQPGENVTLSWKATAGLNQCTASSSPTALWSSPKSTSSGSDIIRGLTQSHTFTLTCIGTAGGGVGTSERTSQVFVEVSSGGQTRPPPTADIKVSPNSVKAGVNPNGPTIKFSDLRSGRVTFIWSSTNAETCQGRDDFQIQEEGPSGEETHIISASPPRIWKYSIFCEGASDTITIDTR